MSFKQERRRFTRTDDRINIKYRVLDAPYRSLLMKYGDFINFSAGGMLFRCIDRFDSETVLRVGIELSDIADSPEILLNAQVKRCDFREDQEAYYTAVEFKHFDNEIDQFIIEEYIQKYLKNNISLSPE